MIRLVTFTLFLFLFSLSANAQEVEENQVIAKIEVEQNENFIQLQPTIQNNGELFLEYNYLLLVKKTDRKKNLSVNKQNGRFALSPGEIKNLSTTIINNNDHQTVKAVLYIRDENNNQLITKDSIEIKNSNLTRVDETSLMLKGMVVDESKTKFGKDFYDEFYSTYNQVPEKFNFIILISEQPYRAQTSIIQVKANQDVLYEFFTNPDEEYRKQQVSIALQKVAKYAATKDQIKQEFNY